MKNTYVSFSVERESSLMKMISSFMFAGALVASVMANNGAASTVLVSDDFTYNNGSLVTEAGWISHSGNAGDLLISGNEVVVQHGAPSEDAHVQFALQSTGVLTASFDIVVNDDNSPIASSDFEYFAHFMTDGSFNFRSRLDVQSPNAVGGDYTLGISSASSTAEATLTTDFNFGDVVPVTISFDLDTGTGSLTAGGQTVTGSAQGAQSLDSFALRQSDSSSNETITVDNLVITTSVMAVPEPSSFALLGLVGMAGAIRRRK